MGYGGGIHKLQILIFSENLKLLYKVIYVNFQKPHLKSESSSNILSYFDLSAMLTHTDKEQMVMYRHIFCLCYESESRSVLSDSL